MAYYQQGHLDQALSDFEHAIQLDPEEGDAFYGRGLIYLSKGDKQAAIADFKKALDFCDRSSVCDDAGQELDKLGQGS